MNPYIKPGMKLPEEIIAEAFGTNINELKSRLRHRHIAEARQLAMYYYFIHKESGYSLMRIGRKFNRDHSTVIHAVKTVRNLLEYDKSFQEKVKSIKHIIIT